ncbi:putative nuclear RNA export factor SDE5 [Sesamum angolense]|uniref:Nuclear RNA export factor SDE5 n=1 Tax=Sesamum angolense TaxID=2727404 RepID=A0AAE1WRN7_9LAMI|nr:putative nuclear RNA export factor SDE5 [Sesamum angolense]
MIVVPPSSFSYTDEDQKNLKELLEAFGSIVSLDDIASAYCEAGRNLCDAAEILCNKQGSISGTSSSKSQDIVENTTSASSGGPSNNILENAHITKSKSRKCSASMGTVSNVIGKDYITPRPQSNGLNEKLKPVKINSDDFPVSEIWDEKKDSASTSRSESMNSDVEEFLYKMLGNGFQLEKSLIQDVVGQCGYNMDMSIDKLLDLSAATLEKSDDVIGIAAGNVKVAFSMKKDSLDLGSMSSRTESPVTDFSGRSKSDASSGEPRTEMKKKDISREVLEALFSVPDVFEEKQECSNPIRPCRRLPYGQVVSKPPKDKFIEDFTFITRQPNARTDEANQSSYEDLRKAVMEYWMTMKEYYKAAVDAFSRKDYENSQVFLEEGRFYMRKAREADEKSAQKLIEDSEEEEFSLNMHYLEPKDALHHMKLHLTSLSAFCYLKFVVGLDDGDKKDVRRKRLITKLLEKEGIPWTEEGNGWTISIRVDEIDPKKLSFANK